MLRAPERLESQLLAQLDLLQHLPVINVECWIAIGMITLRFKRRRIRNGNLSAN